MTIPAPVPTAIPVPACRPGVYEGLPDDFFPVSKDPLAKGNPEREATLRALACCARCPVQAPCRELHATDPYAVAGGTLPVERGAWNGDRNDQKRARPALRPVA